MTSHDDPTPRGAEPDAPAGSAHTPPPGAPLMSALRWALFAFLLVLAVASVGSYLVSRRPAAPARVAATKVIWRCPMHPSYTSDHPGECPICGMTLERIEVGAASAAGAPATGGDVPGLVPVQITPERIQQIGVRTAIVQRASGDAESGGLELVGFVAPDEARLARVHIRVAGWIRELDVDAVGERVEAGQPLLAIDSPELSQSEQEYLIERGVRDSMAGMAGMNAAGSAGERLRWLGVPEDEIRRLDREGVAATRIALRSPYGGTVLERDVAKGQYVGADTPLLTLADLSRVWVLADLYEMDIPRVHAGDPATFTVDALPGRTFTGRVDFVYPTVSSETRTLKARIALANDDGALRPGMFGRVRVAGRGGPALWVPAEAVVNAGEHSYVFLAHAGGVFEPRRVWTGTPEGERIRILRGVAAGDTVVSSASFLIDSESRLQAAIAGMGAQPGMADMPGASHAPGAGR